MSSEVDICNLALSHIGDVATIASISPPEASIQSMHCARFYPIARDALLEEHTWSFCTRRIALTLLAETVDQWAYVYSLPNLMKRAIAVIPDEATDDYNIPAYEEDYTGAPLIPNAGSYAPQPFAIETLSTGVQVICTNQENAVLRYIVMETDTSKYSAMFVVTLSWLLASMIAGPIIKGDVGAAEAKRCLGMSQVFSAKAKDLDSNQRRTSVTHVVPWLAAR